MNGDEGQRTFGMHQLLQQAVGRELVWLGQCERMRQLLHTRCGQFGDEVCFDVGLYGVMREVAEAALFAVGRVKEEGEATVGSWCSGMLLRLYEVARDVYGAEAEFPNRVFLEAEGGAEAAVGWGDDGGAIGAGRGLRAMRWRWHTLTGDAESYERMMDEIGGVHGVEAEAGDKWAAGVALGAACHVAGGYYNGPETRDKAIAAYERAVRMRLDALGEQHPDTATTLASLGSAYCNKGNDDMAIMLCERALRIFKDALGQHPTTAYTMSSMGAAYGNKGQNKKAIELYEQALGIFERTVGRMHRDAALAIYSMSIAYCNMGDFVKAEELGVEALRIYEDTLGHDHEKTEMARDDLAITRKKMGKH